MASKMTLTASERARKRATQSRLRAICNTPGKWYTVHNLTSGSKYIVWYSVTTTPQHWECTCHTNSLQHRCKHVQRVLDREERRNRQEALANG